MSRLNKHMTDDFTIIGDEILQDNSISLQAKGLIAQLFSYPDDWNFSIVKIAKDCKDSWHSIAETLEELESAGYLKRNLYRNEFGIVTDIQYEIYSERKED